MTPDLIGIIAVSLAEFEISVPGLFFWRSLSKLCVKYNLSFMTPDSTETVAVAHVALRISVPGISHLALAIKTECKCLMYPS